MVEQQNHKSPVPASIHLLFNNEKLDLMKVLCLMNAFSNQSNKQRKVDEIIFYYSLVNFNLICLIDSDSEKNNVFAPSPNLYYRFQTKINSILLMMYNLEFIDVKGDMSKKIGESKVKLLPHGKRFFEGNKSGYFDDLFEKYIEVYEEISYSSENIKKIRGGNFE